MELLLSLAVSASPAADALGRAGGQLLVRAVAHVAAPPAAATCKADRPRTGWIGVPPKTTGYRTW